jgi:AmmeMemoRadiSam system protein A
MNEELKLTDHDRKQLLALARQSIQLAVSSQLLPDLDHDTYADILWQEGASFVTLTENGMLRGCIGTLEAYQPLVEDVREHAIAAALQDFRFPNVRPEEVQRIHIEISRLTPSEKLEYEDPYDLLAKLNAGVDGVVLRDGMMRSTFLPQVWETLPAKVDFLNLLCQKMGASASLWRKKELQVSIYHVEEFEE